MTPTIEIEQLKSDLKYLIVHACNKEIDPETIDEKETLIGKKSNIGLDSLDILQVNVAIMNQYKVRIDDSKHARRVMKSITTLAEFIISKS